MGWSRGFHGGREVGYAVDAVCDADGCDTEIDRGLAYKCGDLGSDCWNFYCYEHLATWDGPGFVGPCCAEALSGEEPRD